MFGLSKRTLAVIASVAGVLLLYVTGPKEVPDGTERVANPTQCRVTVIADVLRVRAAPDLNAPIVDRFKRDAVTDADKVVENGFRKVGENRWAAEEFLTPLPGHDCGS